MRPAIGEANLRFMMNVTVADVFLVNSGEFCQFFLFAVVVWLGPKMMICKLELSF